MNAGVSSYFFSSMKVVCCVNVLMQRAITSASDAFMPAQASGVNALTDPLFSKRVSPVQFFELRCARPPSLSVDHLSAIDVVHRCHNLDNQFDINTAAALEKRAQVVPFFIAFLNVLLVHQDTKTKRHAGVCRRAFALTAEMQAIGQTLTWSAGHAP